MVYYYGNSIIYSQHTYDSPGGWFAYEHSCFKIFGGNVDIHDNFIDGTGAVVERSAKDGIFGNHDNPISILHSLPCKADGRNNVLFSGNKAKGYGVVLRCRAQDTEEFVKDYDILLERNSFADRGFIVLDRVENSTIEIVDNVCNTKIEIQGNNHDNNVNVEMRNNEIDPFLDFANP